VIDTPLLKSYFCGIKLRTMRRVIKVLAVLAIILLNIVAFVPGLFNKAVEQKETCVLQQPKIKITDMIPVIIPSLFKASK
jgi:hypothetical protein